MFGGIGWWLNDIISGGGAASAALAGPQAHDLPSVSLACARDT